MERQELIVGHVYRGKRFAKGIFGGNNDRVVLWIGGDSIQYDSDTVGLGKHYPKITIDKFLRWVKEDVTEESKKGEG